MGYLKITIIACFLVASTNAQNETTTAQAETTTIAAQEVCDDACAVIHLQIVAQAAKLNLELEKIRQEEMILMGIVTATSGTLLTIKQLFTNKLSGDEQEAAESEFVDYLVWALGDEIKATGELASLLDGSYTEDEIVETLVSGIFNDTRETTISTSAYAQLYVSAVSSMTSFAGKIAAIYESNYQANFQGSRGTSRHAAHHGHVRAHHPVARHHGRHGARHHSARHHGQKRQRHH